MPPSYILCLVLLFVSVLAFGRSGRSKWAIGVFLVLAVTSSLFLIGWCIANHFTGEGINAATLYHVYYGFRGAGFREYWIAITVSVAALMLGPILLASYSIRGRKRPRRAAYQTAAFVLAAGSLASNPGASDLLVLWRDPPVQTIDFFRHYRTPVITATTDEHPNFVFIFGESLERTYFDEKIFPGLITELRLLETNGVSFTNIHTLQGTGFTMGGLVAAFCGIPLFTPSHPNSMTGMDEFLPGAKALSDLLHEQGYYLSFYGGGHREFAGKGKFFETHKFDEAIGFSDLHPKIKDPKYISNWGLYDDSLLEIAFTRYTELSGENKPFGLFILTLDTHSPNGHVSKSVAASPYQDGSNPMLNAVKASDRLIADFVRKIQSSPHGKNTIVVIVSDHIAMPNSATALLERGERRNLFLVLDPRRNAGERVERSGSSLDTASTLLPFLGFKGSIGLGRDLRDPRVADAEIAQIQETRTLLSWRKEFEQFWEFPKFEKSLSFQAEPAAVTIDGRRFQAPVLVQLDERNRTTLRFEFDATWDVRLAQQAQQLPKGTPYLLVAARDDLKTAFRSVENTAADAAWLLIVGKAGLGERATALKAGSQISRKQVDELLNGWR